MKVKNKTALFLWIFLILIAGLSLFWIMNSPSKEVGKMAQIWIDEQLVETIPLDTSNDQVISLEHYGKDVTLEIKNHAIHFLQSDCPDKICINTGWLTLEDSTAVCLPNQVSVIITDGSTKGVSVS